MTRRSDQAQRPKLVTVRFKQKGLKTLWDLSRERWMWVIEGSPMRISTLVHTRAADVELLFETIGEALG